jgi:hypothetical protein
MLTDTTPAPDAAILNAWERRTAAYARYNALPSDVRADPTFSFADGMTDAERREWAIIDEAEADIVEAVATTPAGVAAQLWTALSHIVTERRHVEAVQRGDLVAMIAFNHELDWNEKLIVSALRSLYAMEG